MTFRLSLRYKLFAFFIVIGIFIISAITLPAYYLTRSALLQRTESQLISLRATKQAQLKHYFEERRKDLLIIAQSETLIKFSPQSPHSFIPDKILQYVLVQDKDPHTLMIYDDSAGLFTLYTAPLFWQWRKENQRPAALSNRLQNIKAGETRFIDCSHSTADSLFSSLCIVYRLHSVPKQNRFLILSVSPHSIDRILKGENGYKGLGLSGETYAVGADRFFRSSSRFSSHQFYPKPIQTQSVDLALSGAEGLLVTEDYRGILVLSSYGSLSYNGLHWAILTEIDWVEVTDAVHHFTIYLIALSIFLIFVLIFISYFIARHLTQPIIQLKQAFHRLEQGFFDGCLPVTSRDEFGMLLEGFNRTVEKLNTKTSELQQSEQRLRHFYNATPDGILFHQEQKIILVNSALCRLTGFHEADLLGRTLTILFPSSLSQTDESVLYETYIQCANGNSIPVEVRHTSIDNHGERLQVIVIHDISRRKEIEQALRHERVRRISSVIDGQEEERQRIARELHDSLGQYLIAIRLQLENARLTSPAYIQKILTDTIDLCDKTVEETRRISDDLMPSVFYELGFLTALKNLCTHLSQPGKLVIYDRITLSVPPQNERLQMYLFRIAQEALVNVVRHAHASFAVIFLHENNNEIILRILDNGCGFELQNLNKKRNLGIHNIRTRVNLLNGKLIVQSFPDHGTIVDVRIPVRNKTKLSLSDRPFLATKTNP